MKTRIKIATGLLVLSLSTPLMYSSNASAAQITNNSIAASVMAANKAAVSGDTIVEKAEGWVGTPYKMGGNSKKGVDCSHFVNLVYKEAGISYTYTTATDWTCPKELKKVSTPQKGDIVIFGKGDTDYGHAGIYIDSKTFIGAQSGGVAEAKFGTYWGKTRPIVGYYRAK